MVDNFDKTQKFFDFDSNNFFIFAQLVRRQKDIPTEKVKEGFIKTWVIRSYDELMKLHDDMVTMSETLRARIYINLSPKSFKKVNAEMLLQLAIHNKQNQQMNPYKITNSAIGVTKSENPRWVVDCDIISNADTLRHWLINENSIIYDEFPTKNGMHFIISPINTKKFTTDFPDVDLHPNSMGTILYVPKSLD